MRWDNLRLVEDPGEDGRPVTLPLVERSAVTRTFDTPEFRGITFYEVHARSIVNRVPAASHMPFQWTINPYRGCSHACAYCLGGETPILMADGRTKPLAEVEVGDAVCGTVRQGSSRRCAVTRVLAHWSTVKPAYRIVLEDGTQLIASADHRFLSRRGWKYVLGAEQGAARRPHLTMHDKLIGVGASAAPGTALESDARLGVTSIEPLGLELPLFDVTTGTGDFIADGVVSHNCFARKSHSYLDLDTGEDFNSRIVVKVNAPELLRRELAAPSWRGEHIAMGTNVDCYQRAEGRYRLMRGILEALRDFANPFSILTKGSLILRDLDLLRQAAEVTEVAVNVSTGFLDKQLWRSLEPGTPSPRKRLEVCRTLNDAGIGCGVLMAPIVPFLTDAPSQLESAVRAAAEAGAAHVSPIVLHLRPGGSREWFMRWLTTQHPDLVPRYLEFYGRGAYAPKAYQREVTDRVRELARRYGVGAARAASTRRVQRRPEARTPTREPAEQLTLL